VPALLGKHGYSDNHVFEAMTPGGVASAARGTGAV
jgi:hypothetical protein